MNKIKHETVIWDLTDGEVKNFLKLADEFKLNVAITSRKGDRPIRALVEKPFDDGVYEQFSLSARPAARSDY